MPLRTDRTATHTIAATRRIDLCRSSRCAWIAALWLTVADCACAQDSQWLRLNRDGMAAMAQGALQVAEQALKLAIQRAESLRTTDSDAGRELSASLNNLGLVYQRSARYRQAESVLRQALALRQQVYGERHRYYAQSLTSLARTLQDQEKFDESERLFSDALAIYSELYGLQHPLVADALNNLGSLHQNTERWQSAESYLRQAIEIQRKLFGPRHPRISPTLSNLASLAVARGDHDIAVDLYTEVIEIRRAASPVDQHGLIIALNNLGTLYHSACQTDEAEKLLEEANGIITAQFNDRHPQAGRIQYRLALIAASTNRTERADELFGHAVAAEQSMFGNHHPRLLPILLSHATLLERIRRSGPAVQTRERAERIRKLNKLTKTEKPEIRCGPETLWN